MNSTQQTCPGFGDFYRNPALSGHIFLQPSLLLLETGLALREPIQAKGADYAIDLLARIITALVLVILAPLVLLFVPIGLLCKGVSSAISSSTPEPYLAEKKVSCKPTISTSFKLQKKPSDQPSSPSQRYTVNTSILSSTASSTVPKPEQHSTQDSSVKRPLLPLPSTTAVPARQTRGGQREIEYLKGQVKLAKQCIEGIQALLVDMQRTHKWNQARFIKYKKQFQSIKVQLEAAFTYGYVSPELEEYRKVYQDLVREYHMLETKPALPGVKHIGANGHCLFLSLATWAYPNSTANELAHHANQLRVQCVDYIAQQYKSNRELQKQLVSSLMDFFESEKIVDQLQSITEKGVLFFNREDIDQIMGIYMQRMRQTEASGAHGIVFGSSAEIYAASEILKAPIQVYFLKERDGMEYISSAPTYIQTSFGDHYIGQGQPVFGLYKTGAHYDVYQPPREA